MVKKSNGSSQNEMLMEHFKIGKSISAFEAQGLYRIARLAACVRSLIVKNIDIKKIMKEDTTGRRYARYYIPEYISDEERRRHRLPK